MRLIYAFAVLAALAVPAWANWTPEQMDVQIENTNVEVGGVCSGTIISITERIVLTAHHCIDQQVVETEEKTVDKDGNIIIRRIQKTLPLSISVNTIKDYEIVHKDQYLVKIVGIDKANDIALLQVVDKDWKPAMKVNLAPDGYTLHRGQKVYAVGNPGIVYGNSITEGIISAPERTVNFGPDMDFKMFQHSAGVIGGNSGGSILNEDGVLIGTLTGGVRGAPISFAIPISFTKALIIKSGFEKILKE